MVHVESVMVQDDVERVGRNGSIIKVNGQGHFDGEKEIVLSAVVEETGQTGTVGCYR